MLTVAHVIEYASGFWWALVDPQGPTPHRAPMTPLSEQVSKTPPVFRLEASWPALVQLMATLPEAALTQTAQAEADRLAATRVTWGDTVRYAPPEHLKSYPWQVQAQAQYPRTRKLRLGDDPGTGKTPSAVLAVTEAMAQGLEGPVLVVTPAGVVTSFLETFHTWAPHLKAHRYAGPKRPKLLTELEPTEDPEWGLVWPVLVTSYDLASRDVNTRLLKHDWGSLVLDEHHLIKNPKSARSKAARKLAEKSAGVIVMSGTPITHHPGDLWPALYCVEPSAWPSQARYKDRYLDTVPADYGEIVAGFLPHRREEFELTMLGTQRRVAKADALPWLPPKVYQVREVELPAEWMKHYKAMEEELVAALPDNDEPLNAFSVLAQLSFLQALSKAPCDVRTTESVNEDGEVVTHYHADLKGPSWTVAELLEVLEERPLDQVVVFSSSRQLVGLAAEALAEAGVTYTEVVGGQSQKDRDRAISTFQAGGARVILVVTGAGGVGITLTAANTAVFLSRPWSLVEALQAEDRLHRIGAEVHESITIVDIVSKGTVDQAIRARLVEKAEQLGDVLKDPRVAREVLGGSSATKATRNKKVGAALAVAVDNAREEGVDLFGTPLAEIPGALEGDDDGNL